MHIKAILPVRQYMFGALVSFVLLLIVFFPTLNSQGTVLYSLAWTIPLFLSLYSLFVFAMTFFGSQYHPEGRALLYLVSALMNLVGLCLVFLSLQIIQEFTWSRLLLIIWVTASTPIVCLLCTRMMGKKYYELYLFGLFQVVFCTILFLCLSA